MSKLSKQAVEELEAKYSKPAEAAADTKDYVNVQKVSISGGTFSAYKEGEIVDLGTSFKAYPLALYTKYMRAGTQKENYRPAGETVLVPQNSRGAKFYDTFGTESCGRAPNAIAKTWSEQAQEENKARGKFYATLFAVSEEGELLALQVPDGKAAAMLEFFKTIETKVLFTNLIEFKMAKQGKVAMLSFATVKIDVAPTSAIAEADKIMEAYVTQENDRVMRSYNYHNRSAGSSITSVAPKLVSDVEGDEIPF